MNHSSYFKLPAANEGRAKVVQAIVQYLSPSMWLTCTGKLHSPKDLPGVVPGVGFNIVTDSIPQIAMNDSCARPNPLSLLTDGVPSFVYCKCSGLRDSRSPGTISIPGALDVFRHHVGLGYTGWLLVEDDHKNSFCCTVIFEEWTQAHRGTHGRAITDQERETSEVQPARIFLGWKDVHSKGYRETVGLLLNAIRKLELEQYQPLLAEV